METRHKVLQYDGHKIDLDISGDDVMINATEMAKIFGKETGRYLELESTKEFIEALVNQKNLINRNLGTPNSGFPNSEIDRDFFVKTIKAGRANGTWMHRYLAIDFAMWLDVSFRVWVVMTIDELIFGKYRDLEQNVKAAAKRKAEMEELSKELSLDPKYQRLELLKLQERQASYSRGIALNQLKMDYEKQSEQSE
jgi:hypothetical protein